MKQSKKTFRLSIKIDKCDIIFKEGMGAGEVAKQDLVFNLSEEEYHFANMLDSLFDQLDRLKDHVIKCSIKEII